jgi:LuxR family maltose regulon positive regulatory protein
MRVLECYVLEARARYDQDKTRARGLIEPISDREREILALIAAGSTNHIISATLFISQNTVKWHLKNIFGKPGVSNRTSAVAVARQLSLLA